MPSSDVSSSQLIHTVRAWEQRVLLSLATIMIRFPCVVLLTCVVLVGVSIAYTAAQLGFVTSRNDLISGDKRYLQLEKEYVKEFVGIDPFVIVVDPQDVTQGKAFVSRLAEILLQDTAHIKEVFYQIDTSALEGKKLLYLSTEDLQTMSDDLAGSHDLIREITTTPGLNTLFEAINHQVSAATVSHLMDNLLGFDLLEEEAEESQENTQAKDTADALEVSPTPQIGFLNSLLQEMDHALARPDYRYQSPWAEFFGGAEDLSNDGFLVSDNEKFVFMMVEPKESPDSGFNEFNDAINVMKQAITTLKPEFPGLDAGLTGIEVLDNDEMMSAQTDTTTASFFTVIGIALLYLIFFKKVRHPVLILSALLVGLAWTMGFVTLTVGHLSLITVFVAPMLLGLADDFGVHFMTRYEEERGQGKDPATALRIVYIHTGPSIIAGACTTALAFAAIVLADFRGVQELGIISSGGILLSLLAMFTFLPALVVVAERLRPWQATVGGRTFLSGIFTGIGGLAEHGRRPLLVMTALLTLGSLVVLPTVTFDYNLLNLQAHGTESVEWEKRIIANSERASWNALATASTPHQAMQKAAAFEALPVVETVESVASFLPSEQTERLPLVRALQPLLAGLPPSLAVPTPVDVAALSRSLDQIRFKVREDNDEWDPDTKPAESELSVARKRLRALVDHLHDIPENEARLALHPFQTALFRDFADKWSLLRNNVTPPGPITLADIPPQLKKRFVSRDETKFLLQIYPKDNIREREPLEEFIHQLRQIDPDVTGSPVIGYESIRAMQEGYVEAALYALVAIVLVSFGTLRRLGDTLLALLPLGLGMVWTAGLMWLFGLQFNLANLVAAPLIIGIGIENGIHLVHRFREDDKNTPAALIAGSTGQAVALFSLTTMVGFGSLMVAKYYGIFSMGLLLTLAIGSVLVASLAVLPLLLIRPVRQAIPGPQAAQEAQGLIQAPE